MTNLSDYILWRGDLSFAQDPLNAIDSLIFSYLVYLRFPEELLSDPDAEVSVDRVEEEMSQLADYRERGNNHQLELLHQAAQSRRFAGVKLVQFCTQFIPEEDTQFAAAAFALDDGSMAVAFRGTDNTLVGWKEDFNMCFQEAVPAQRLAVDYIRQLYGRWGMPMYLCGHSKGGNLAVYAAAKSERAIRQAIREVYNNDGPGFMEHMLSDPGYLEMVPRIHTYVPQSSIIGMLMEHAEPTLVIKSAQVGILQHDVFTWEVMGKELIPVEELTPDSKFVSATIRQWLLGMDLEARNQMVDALFKLLTYGNVERAADIFLPRNIRQYMKLITIDEDIRRILTGEFVNLLEAAKRTIKLLPEETEDSEEDMETEYAAKT